MTLFRVIAIVAALCTVAAAAVLAVTLAPADDHRYSAEIRRTEYGIPHIVASDYASLGYGYGYACGISSDASGRGSCGVRRLKTSTSEMLMRSGAGTDATDATACAPAALRGCEAGPAPRS
jgi:hypothetical protein